MSLLLKQIFQFFRLLNSETGLHQISSGIAAGFVLGMTPALSLQSMLIFLGILVFRIQAGAAFVSAFFFTFIAYLLDPVFHAVGEWVLGHPSLTALFTHLYNMPIVPYTRFNNTIVMGSGVVSLALTPVVFVVSAVLIKKYRDTVVQRFQNTRFWKAVKATGLYKWYHQYEELYG